MIYKKENSKYWYTQFEITYQNKRKRINRTTRQTSKSKAEAFESKLKQDIWLNLINPPIEQHHFDDAIDLYLLSRQTNGTIKKKETN